MTELARHRPLRRAGVEARARGIRRALHVLVRDLDRRAPARHDAPARPDPRHAPREPRGAPAARGEPLAIRTDGARPASAVSATRPSHRTATGRPRPHCGCAGATRSTRGRSPRSYGALLVGAAPCGAGVAHPTRPCSRRARWRPGSASSAGPVRVTYFGRDDWSSSPAREEYWPAYREAYRRIAESGIGVTAVSQQIIDRIEPAGPARRRAERGRARGMARRAAGATRVVRGHPGPARGVRGNARLAARRRRDQRRSPPPGPISDRTARAGSFHVVRRRPRREAERAHPPRRRPRRTGRDVAQRRARARRTPSHAAHRGDEPAQGLRVPRGRKPGDLDRPPAGARSRRPGHPGRRGRRLRGRRRPRARPRAGRRAPRASSSSPTTPGPPGTNRSSHSREREDATPRPASGGRPTSPCPPNGRSPSPVCVGSVSVA